MIFGSIAPYLASGFKPAVCIVGSGPAGLSLALRLESRGIPCVVLEAGEAGYSSESQEACRGTVVGGPYFDLHIARLRQFGGSSNHWTGWCRPLDAVDFLPRPGISPTGWPIRKSDLDPYAEATREILGIGELRADVPVGADLLDIEIKRDPPVRFATRYKARLEQSASTAVVLNAPVFALRPASPGRIDRAIVRTADQREHEVAADHYVMCGGGIENSRLLLWSNALFNGGAVPGAATLGKYWMEHPHHTVGRALLMVSNKRRPMGLIFYAPNEKFIAKHAVGNFGLRLHVVEDLRKALMKDAMCVMPSFAKLVQERFGRGYCGGVVDLAWEQPPLASNRIELDRHQKDASGMPRPILHWDRGDHERRTAELAVQALGSHLVAEDQGRMQLAPWIDERLPFPHNDEGAGFHHMGGTRMSTSPGDGVVDAHCRVHGMANLHVAGSSVFHSGGHANPTFTIVQLALRLGDHLAESAART